MEELRKGVYWFKGYIANSYLLEREGELFLFDVPSPSMVDELLETFKPEKITVFLTHYHFDHLSGILHLDKNCNVSFVFPHHFKELVEGKRAPSFPGPILWIKGLLRVWWRQRFRFIGINDLGRVVVAGVPFSKVRLKLSKVAFADSFKDILFIHTPGHTPESTCYLVDDILISGDTVLTYKGKPYPNPFVVDRENLKKSYNKVLSTGFKLLLPGHGEPIN